jgi:diguanylate cyclase (GGDEF)-like protein
MQLDRLPHEQESVTIWDDAVIKTTMAYDADWVDLNLGSWMNSFFGHDEAVVLDASDRPVYAMQDGHPIDTADIEPELPGIRALIIQLRAQISRGGIADYADGAAEHPPRASDIMLLDGSPAIVSVTPIISDSGEIEQQRGGEYLHISVLRLDASFASRLAGEYMIEAPTFTTIAAVDDSRAHLPLTNRSGRFMTFFEWQLAKPGEAIVRQTIPVLAGAFLVAGLIVFFLLDQLWHKSRALVTGQEAAEHRARHDALTGLPNRASFDADVAQALLARSHGQCLSILLLDLDRFKQVNDTLGHKAGDDLIEAVGQRLRQIVGSTDIVARLGGDEFAILHRHGSGLSEPLTLSHRIIEALGKPFDLFGSEAFVGVSIGVAVAERTDADTRELTRRADIALYEAKASGRNRVVVFEEHMSELLQNRHVLEADLREALRAGNQLSVSFQPLYGRDATDIIGAEALVRWHHPRLGLVSPAHFIPVAEASGLIEPLGDFVMRIAAELGAACPGRVIAVNVSPTQLRNHDFPTRVLAVLRETGMRPADLEIEITENILLEDAHAASEAIHLLRAEGVRIALDDFGTGYSSLNYLKRYPVDRIKIDRSFVSQLAVGNVSVAIVEAMVKLAHALKIEVTAEGVETEEQHAILRQLGCNVFQGFLFSPPIARSSIETLLRQQGKQPQSRVA